MLIKIAGVLLLLLSLVGCGGGGGGVQPTTYPSISLSTSTSSVAENSGTTVTLTVTASKTSTEDITVTLSTSGTATDGTDYSAVNGSSLTITAGTTTATKTFTITDNSIYEGNETIVVAISTVSGGSATESGSQSETITITENESAPVITLASSTSSVAENSGTTITLTATSSQVADEDVVVTLASSGAATNGIDYSSLGGQTITISAGSTTGTITSTPTDDFVYESNETATIAISAVSGGGATESGSQSVSITITENESAPAVTLTSSASSITENSGTSVTLTATASQTADEDIIITLSTSGVATDGTDYTSINSTTITISAGSTTGTKSFTPTDDSVYEGDEVATIAISTVSGGGATERGTQSETITITENESAPTVTMSASQTSAAENSGTEVTLTLTTSQVADEDIVVSLSASGTISSSDYVSTSLSPSTVTISAGDTTGTVSATPSDDSIYEGNESSTVSISSVSGADATESGTQSITFTITENESAPVITLSTSHTTVAENSGTTVTLTATTSQVADEAITITLASTGTAINGTDYSSLGGQTITISANSETGTITGTPTDDTMYEGDEVATISISDVSGIDATESGDQSVSITITENELAPIVTLTESATSINENSGSSITFTLALEIPAGVTQTTTSEDVIVQIGNSVAGYTATASGSDYQLSSTSITIPSGSSTSTFTFSPIDDNIYEGANGQKEWAYVTIDSVSGGGSSFDNEWYSITINDNESAPTVSFDVNGSASASVYDNGSSLTLTATSTQAADEDITVLIGTSGTAKEGRDYGNISDITIAAGETTGATTFNPTEDTVNEGSETATISITSVSGADSSTSGTTSVTITINEYALNTGTQLTYNSSNATTLAATTEFGSFNYSSAASEQNPLEVINAHKAYGYGLTGSGKQIAIMDSGFSTSHTELDSKTISTFGTLTAATGVSSADDHGLFVSSVAAAEDDGDGGMQGVAPSADLHLSSYDQLNRNTYYPTHWANATDNASSAVVQNNSWGINYQIDALQSDISVNGWSNDYGIAQKFNSSGLTANEASATSYITALNNFQDHGVIVYALSNTRSYTDADFQAALPVLFPQLEEAWITAVNIEVDGTSGNETYTRKSAPCGSTAEYCLGADGWQVNGAGGAQGVTGGYWTNEYGTSFVAPQISGAVALLAEAFPNHTPAQLTDRLLASADNSFFTHTGGVTFGNGVEHGYNTEFGHGIMDIYAALNPVTTSAYTRLFTGGSNQDEISYSLGNSRIISSKSFGDSLVRGLEGEIGYAYDALSGGFKYDMTTRIDVSNNDAPTISLASEMAKLDSLLAANNPSWKNNFSQVLSQLSKTDNLETSLTVGAGSLPVQSFFGSNFDSSISLNDYETPYLESGEGGIGLGATYKLGNSRLLVGMTNPINQGNDNTIGLRKSLVASLEYGNPSDTAVTFMTGATQDNDSLLGSTGNDAYGLSGSKSDTVFTAFKAQTQLGNNLSLTGVATLANTNMTRPDNSFVNSASNVKSTSVSLIANKRDLFGDDSMSFFVSQPNRVSDGNMSIRLSNLADSDGNLTYRNKDIHLKPTARQLDYGLSYRKDIDKDISFSVKHMMTDNLNHKQDSQTVSSSFIGAKYKDLKVGFAKNPGEDSRSTKVLYAYKF